VAPSGGCGRPEAGQDADDHADDTADEGVEEHIRAEDVLQSEEELVD
jgi:hypothetical protein